MVGLGQTQAWEGEEGAQHGAYRRQPHPDDQLDQRETGEKRKVRGSLWQVSIMLQVAACLVPPPFSGLTPSPSLVSSVVAPSSGSYCPGLGKTKKGWCPVDPWGLRAHSVHTPPKTAFCSPGRNVLASARPCDKHEDNFVVQLCAAQNVLGRHH